jgi:hypothetical protein
VSRHLLAILLSELKTVRVKCKKCGAIAELPLDKLGDVLNEGQCRFCKEGLHDVGARPLADLVKAIGEAARVRAEIEFVIPEDGGAPAKQ